MENLKQILEKINDTLTTRKVAQKYNVSINAVQNLFYRGKMNEPAKIAGRYIFTPKEVEEVGKLLGKNRGEKR